MHFMAAMSASAAQMMLVLLLRISSICPQTGQVQTLKVEAMAAVAAAVMPIGSEMLP